MIIDAHVHVWKEEENAFAKGKGTSDQFKKDLAAKGAPDRVILLPIAPHVENAFIASLSEENSERVIGFASVHPYQDDAILRLTEDVKKYHLKGLKLHPRVQNISLEDPRVIALVQSAAELKIPILIDCFPQRVSIIPFEELIPERIGELAARVPQANIILAHVGGCRMWDAFTVARAHENIYLDFSFSPIFFKDSSIQQDLAFVLRKIGAHRCIYGSDYPEVSFEEGIGAGRTLIEQARLSSEEADFFFGKTILSLL